MIEQDHVIPSNEVRAVLEDPQYRGHRFVSSPLIPNGEAWVLAAQDTIMVSRRDFKYMVKALC